MKRNSKTLFLESPNATTPVDWVNNAPDFSSFTDPTLSVLQKAWQDFLDSGQELEIIPDPEPMPEPPIANWDMFNLQMMSDTRFNQVYNQCLSVAPIVANALPVALDQITSKGNSLFTLIWTQLCSIGGATEDDKIVWVSYATNNNLPGDFINILGG
jgi:hypothetical protein